MRGAGLLVVLSLVACNGSGEDTDTGTPVVVEGPSLAHEPPTDVFVEGDAIDLVVTATDDQGVLSVQGSWRPLGAAVWENVPLDEGETDTYTLTVDSAPAPGIEYFFRATDGSEYAAVSLFPAGGEDEPLTIDVLTQGAPLPWTEDFEATASNIYDLGWLEFSYGFPGYTFDLTESVARDDVAAQHGRGLEELGAMDDWFVTPPLDFSAATTAQIQWWEHGAFTSGAQHTLWASTRSPDPEDEDFVEIASLPAPPEGRWHEAVAVPLDDLVGEPLVYLAFRYEGTNADIWTVDDIEVGPLTSDLRIDDVAWTRFDPGASGTLTVSLTNPSTVDALNVSLSGATDAADGSFSAPVDVGTLLAGETTTADLTLTVDAAFPDNTWLPITLTATADDSGEVREDEVLVGDATTATLELTTFDEGLVVATVGTGDPAAPDLEVEATTRVYAAGSYQIEVDLTPHAAMLPPGPGLDRWWMRVSSAAAGSLDGFAIASGSDSWVSDDLGAWPASVETLYYLPRPPEPAVLSSVTTPSPVLPGDLADWTLTLVNYGPATSGITTALVSTADPDVALNTPGPFSLGSDWAENDSASLPLNFLVYTSQDDSQPIRFEVVVTDEIESFLVEVDVPVPWPLIDLTGALVEDSLTGNGDGLPDSGESFDLTVELTNSGELGSFGPVLCSLSQTGGAATATITDATALFSQIGAGQTQSDSGITLAVSAGAAGDDLQLLLTCTDDETTYELPFELVVGEPPWRALTAVQDPIGDHQDYGWDFQSADYRVVNGELQLRLVSAVPYDSSTLFLEAYLDSVGAPYFDYNLILQSGDIRMRGRDVTGYSDLVPAPSLTEIDSQTLLIELPLAPLELVQDQLTIGFGAGYCGAATYYCDHYPNAWGAPYQGMDMSLWAPVSW